MPHGQDIMELSELTLNLIQLRRLVHQKEHTALVAGGDWNTKDCFKVKCSTSEQSRNVRHDPRVIAHTEVENVSLGSFNSGHF